MTGRADIILKIATLLSGVLLLNGCETFRHLPAETANPGKVSVPVSRVNIAPIEDRDVATNNFDSAYRAAAASAKAGIQHSTSRLIDKPDVPVHQEIRIELEKADVSYGPESILSFFALSTIPVRETTTYRINTSIQDGEKVLFSTSSMETMKRYVCTLPLLFLYSTEGKSEFSKMTSSGVNQNLATLKMRLAEDRQAVQRVLGASDHATRHQWLSQENNNLYRHEVLRYLAAHPQGDTIAWHRQNMDRYADYSRYLPSAQAVWFSGPSGRTPADIRDSLKAGQSAEILAARIKSQGGSYPSFTDEQVTTLKQGGITEEIIVAMLGAGPANGGTAPSADQIRRQQPRVADLVLDNTSGKYMNPWTRDGVLADWVDKAINAKMGSTAGSAAGAAAGAALADQALDNVPGGGLIGGFLGSKAGEAVGREAAIDEQYIRETSDQSFRSLRDMARYLKATYAGTRHYGDAIKAANEIYPGLLEAIRQQ